MGANITARLSTLAIVALISSCGLASDAQQRSRYMELGENRLPPLAFTAYCLRKPSRCLPADEIREIPLTEKSRRELGNIQGDVNSAITPLVLLPTEPDTAWDDEVTRGTCHDYALTKRSRLLDRGYPSSALLLALAYVPTGAHLVLVVVTDQGDYVMDNLMAEMQRWDRLPYRWVMRSLPQNPQHWRTIVSTQVISEFSEPPALSRACDLSGPF